MFDPISCADGSVGKSLSDQDLEDELACLASHIAAAECHFVLLVAEMDRRGTWAAGGLASMAHWLNWRCGLSRGAAREQVRVGRALEALPVLRAAFATGCLSYSKARAITRVATPDTEPSLVELARYTTAAQLEHIVREYRKASPDEGAKAEDGYQGRYLRSVTDDKGMVTISARLSPDDAAVVLAAIDAVRQQASLDRRAATDAVGEFSTWEMSGADALVEVGRAALAGGLDDQDGPPVASVIAHVDQEVLAHPERQGCCTLEGVGAISAQTARRIACDATVHQVIYGNDGTVEPGSHARSIPRRARRAVLARDRGCRFPGCDQRRFVDVHHVVFWSDGGLTVPTNLVCLCRRHHRLVHEGGFSLDMDTSSHVRAFDPSGAEVLSAPALPALDGAPLGWQSGWDIDEHTLSYGGEQMDLDEVMCCLLN